MTNIQMMTYLETKRGLPIGWRWVLLGEVIERISNGTTVVQNSQKKGFPVTRIETISSGNINTERTGWIDSPAESLQRYILSVGDILFSHINSLERLGNCAIYMGTPPILIHGMNLLRIEISKEHIDPSYLLFYLRSQEARDFYSQKARRAIGQASLNTSDISKLPIPLPSLSEQQRIVAALNEQMLSVQKARSAAEAQLDAAKELSAAYLREVFESMEAQQWPKKRIHEFAETSSGSTPLRSHIEYYDGTIPWVKTAELRDSIILYTEEHISETALREVSLKLLPVNTLLVAMYGQGQTRGRTGLLSIAATTNQACFAILPRPAEFDSFYLQLWFRHSYARLRRETEGRGGNQPNLNGFVLRNQEVPLPPLSEQHRIATKLAQQMALIERGRQALEKQLYLIEQLPALYLRCAFNGEL